MADHKKSPHLAPPARSQVVTVAGGEKEGVQVEGAVPACLSLHLFLLDPAPLTQLETVDETT